MRIFLVLSGTPTGGIGQSTIWLRNLYAPLLDLNHDVVLVDATPGVEARRRRDPQLRADFSDTLIRAFRRAHRDCAVDLVFAYLMDGMVEPAAIDEIRRAGVPTVNFSCNNTHQFDLVETLSSHFDYSAHSERDTAQKFRAVGGTPIWFPMAANPTYYHPIDVPRRFGVTFVGQKYAKRPAYLLHLLDEGIPVDVFGPGWQLSRRGPIGEGKRAASRLRLAALAAAPKRADLRATRSAALAWFDMGELLRRRYPQHLHPPLSDEDMIRLYSESAISLGFTEVFDQHNPSLRVKTHLHLRDFEGPMCGALYVTGDCPEIDYFYERDREIVTYRDANEMIEKVGYYLAHEDAANAVRKAGRARALEDHTYHKRWTTLFRQILGAH
jgi:spore maturation protein CgeB